MAEKRRSNEVLRRAIETYQEAASLPDAPTDLVKLSLKRRSERQQFLGEKRSAKLERDSTCPRFGGKNMVPLTAKVSTKKPCFTASFC